MTQREKDEKQEELNKRLIELCRYSWKLEKIKGLIDEGADINYQTENGFSPLIVGVSWHNHDVVEYLLKNGANVDLQDASGWTSLIHSIFGNDIKNMKSLLQYGANVDLQDISGKSAINYATTFPVLHSHPKGVEKALYKLQLLEDHIEKKKLLLVQKRLALGKLFYSGLGKVLVEEGLYEQISSFV